MRINKKICKVTATGQAETHMMLPWLPYPLLLVCLYVHVVVYLVVFLCTSHYCVPISFLPMSRFVGVVVTFTFAMFA